MLALAGYQVRTEWQHRWAEWFERLADQYGRGIRYGEPPAHGGDATQEMVDSLITLADQIAGAEETGGTPRLNAVTLALAATVVDRLRPHQSDREPHHFPRGPLPPDL